MRIRSLVPKFWESEDIEQHTWDTRLVFIGLWSYADDNGVGRDDPRLIAADLFPLAEDPRECRAKVSRGLQALCEGGQITRYTIDGAPFFYVNTWDRYQRVDRPGKPRYPRPTCEDTGITIEIAKGSRNHRESPSTGEGEQRRRGEEEKGLEKPSSSATPPTESATTYPATFQEFWKHYPRKVGKDAALKAWRQATKRAPAADITAGVQRYATDPHREQDPQYIPHPAKWLNGGHWTDEPAQPRHNHINGYSPSTSEQRAGQARAIADEYREQEAADEQLNLQIGTRQ